MSLAFGETFRLDLKLARICVMPFQKYGQECRFRESGWDYWILSSQVLPPLVFGSLLRLGLLASERLGKCLCRAPPSAATATAGNNTNNENNSRNSTRSTAVLGSPAMISKFTHCEWHPRISCLATKERGRLFFSAHVSIIGTVNMF